MRCPAAITGSIAAAANVFDTATKATLAGSRPASRQARAISARTAESASGLFMLSGWRVICVWVHVQPGVPISQESFVRGGRRFWNAGVARTQRSDFFLLFLCGVDLRFFALGFSGGAQIIAS